MTKKRRWNIVSGDVRSADFAPFCSGVCHTATHSIADNAQLQLREHAADLYKGVCHRVDLSAATIYADTADNGQPQALFFDSINNITKLLGASGKARNL